MFAVAYTDQTDKNYDTGEVTHSIRARVIKVCQELDRLHEKQQELYRELKDLEAQGMTCATLHWRDTGNRQALELLHPSGSDYVQQTGRRREYIGVKDDRIREAKDRVKRWREHRDLSKELKELEDKMRDINFAIDRLEHVAFAKQSRFWG